MRRAARVAVPAVMFLVLSWGGYRPASGTLTEDLTTTHGGLTRYFDVYVPDGTPSGRLPLLILLHGGTQSNDDLHVGPNREYMSLADLHRFLLIIPNGTSSTTGQSAPAGAFNWNDCRSDAGAAATTADDVGFISALIDWAAANYQVDLERVYATGSSNGGLMAYRLSLELSTRIAAVAAVIANLPANSECSATPAEPTPILIMNGAAETYFMPWNGGQAAGNRGVVLSAPATRDFWRSTLDVSPTPAHVTFRDVNAADSSTVAVDIYCGGAEGSSVAFYTVTGGGHTLPSVAHYIGAAAETVLGKQNRDLEGPAEIWRFLSRQRLHGTAGTAVCGDGCVGPGEVCDDGNTLDGDCCSATCQAALSCALCEACDLGQGLCVAGPRPSCQQLDLGGKSTLSIRNYDGEQRDCLTWKWTGGEAAAVGGFGNPATTDDYQICLWDASGLSPALLFGAHAPAGGTCAQKPCWRQLDNGGFRYADKDKTPDGINRVLLKPTTGSKGRTYVSGRGVNLSDRLFGLPVLPPPLPLRAQLQGEGGACYETTYTTADVITGDTVRFKATVEGVAE